MTLPVAPANLAHSLQHRNSYKHIQRWRVGITSATDNLLDKTAAGDLKACLHALAQSAEELREELRAQTAALGTLQADVAAAEAQRAQELQETVARCAQS